MGETVAREGTTSTQNRITTVAFTHQKRTLPYDINAERAVLGRSIIHPRHHREARLFVDVDDLWLPEHRHLWRALDSLDDIGGWVGPDTTTWRPVLAHRVRASAAATIADLPDMVVAGLVELSGDLRTNATTIVEHADRRRRILALEHQLAELAS